VERVNRFGKKAALDKVGYPFFGPGGEDLALKEKIVSVHMEGGICGDILAEKVVFIETKISEGKP